MADRRYAWTPEGDRVEGNYFARREVRARRTSKHEFGADSSELNGFRR
jgi:hypothetical protein